MKKQQLRWALWDKYYGGIFIGPDWWTRETARGWKNSEDYAKAKIIRVSVDLSDSPKVRRVK